MAEGLQVLAAQHSGAFRLCWAVVYTCGIYGAIASIASIASLVPIAAISSYQQLVTSGVGIRSPV